MSRKLSDYPGETPDQLLVETPPKLAIHPDDLMPACPFCNKLETGVIEWIKGYPKFYCYNCSVSFYLQIKRGLCTRLPDKTVSPMICRACKFQVVSMLQKKCLFFNGFLPYPQQILDAMKKQKVRIA